jgi:hypothetical protein
MSEAKAVTGRVVRWAARLTSLASATFVALAATVPAAPPTPAESVALLLFPGGVVVGFAVAWWREGLGGAISVVSLAAFYGWMALVRSAPGGPYFVLLTGPAFLFLPSGLLHRPRAGGPAAVRMA